MDEKRGGDIREKNSYSHKETQEEEEEEDVKWIRTLKKPVKD